MALNGERKADGSFKLNRNPSAAFNAVIEDALNRADPTASKPPQKEPNYDKLKESLERQSASNLPQPNLLERFFSIINPKEDTIKVSDVLNFKESAPSGMRQATYQVVAPGVAAENTRRAGVKAVKEAKKSAVAKHQIIGAEQETVEQTVEDVWSIGADNQM
ncbi:MAG: hypothetical protein Q8L51_02555 [Candidatus Amesbacteria bacterium]|nr:hypothetical protein [Candidatus Amesbacteria bacterium]